MSNACNISVGLSSLSHSLLAFQWMPSVCSALLVARARTTSLCGGAAGAQPPRTAGRRRLGRCRRLGCGSLWWPARTLHAPAQHCSGCQLAMCRTSYVSGRPPSVSLLSLILLSLTLTQQRASVRLGPCVPQHHALRQCQPSNARVQRQSVCLAAGHPDISCGLERPLHRVMATVCVSAMPCFGLDEACKSFEAEKTP